MRFVSVVVALSLLNFIFIDDFQVHPVHARLRKLSSVQSSCCFCYENLPFNNENSEQEESVSEQEESDFSSVQQEDHIATRVLSPAVVKQHNHIQLDVPVIKELEKAEEVKEEVSSINFKTVREAANQQEDSPQTTWHLWNELKDTSTRDVPKIGKKTADLQLHEMQAALWKNNFAAIPKHYTKFVYDGLTDVTWKKASMDPLLHAVFPKEKYCFYWVSHQRRGGPNGGHLAVFHLDSPSLSHGSIMMQGMNIGKKRKPGFENNRSNAFYLMDTMHPSTPKGVAILAELLWETTRFFEQAFVDSKTVKLWLPDTKILPSAKDHSSVKKQYPPKQLALATRPNCSPFEESAFHRGNPECRNNGIPPFSTTMYDHAKGGVDFHLSGDDGVIFFSDEVVHSGLVLKKEKNLETGKFEIKKPEVSNENVQKNVATPPMELYDLAGERFGILESEGENSSSIQEKSGLGLTDLSNDVHIRAIVWENLEEAFDNLFLNGGVKDFEDESGLGYKKIFCSEFKDEPENVSLRDIFRLNLKYETRYGRGYDFLWYSKNNQDPNYTQFNTHSGGDLYPYWEQVTVRQQVAQLSGEDAYTFAKWFGIREEVAVRFKEKFAEFLEESLGNNESVNENPANREKSAGSFAEVRSGKKHGG